MDVSRLSFTRKTQEAMKKDLSVRQRGRLLFAKLQELDNDGTLSKATSRADVATLVGYTEEQAKAGYSWVSNLINRGHLSEIVQGWTPSGKMIAEYHMTGTEPSYGYEEAKRRKEKKKAGQELRRWQDKVAAGQIPQAPESPVIQVYGKEQIKVDAPTVMPIRIEITRGDMTIKVEMDSHEEASKLITTIMRGE